MIFPLTIIVAPKFHIVTSLVVTSVLFLSVPPELPQQHVCKEEEVLTDQQLCNQERNSSLDQEEPKPPQTKVEQEEMCTSQEGEQLVLKQETETFMLTPDYEESDDREPEPVGEHQLLSQNSPEAESQDQHRRKHVDSGSTRDEEVDRQRRLLDIVLKPEVKLHRIGLYQNP